MTEEKNRYQVIGKQFTYGLPHIVNGICLPSFSAIAIVAIKRVDGWKAFKATFQPVDQDEELTDGKFLQSVAAFGRIVEKEEAQLVFPEFNIEQYQM